MLTVHTNFIVILEAKAQADDPIEFSGLFAPPNGGMV